MIVASVKIYVLLCNIPTNITALARRQAHAVNSIGPMLAKHSGSASSARFEMNDRSFDYNPCTKITSHSISMNSITR